MPRYSREAAQSLAMTIPSMTGRALTTGITHVISLNARNGPPGRCRHDPTGQMKRLRLGEDTLRAQPAWEAYSLTPGPTGLTTPPPRVSQVTRTMRVSWASLLCKLAEDAWSGEEPRTLIYAAEPTAALTALGHTALLLFLCQLILATSVLRSRALVHLD